MSASAGLPSVGLSVFVSVGCISGTVMGRQLKLKYLSLYSISCLITVVQAMLRLGEGGVCDIFFLLFNK